MAAIATVLYYFFFIFILIISSLLLRSFKSRTRVLHPPSPLALPFIGHIHLLSSVLPKSFQTLARSYGPLMKIRIGASAYVVASNAAVAKQILKIHDADFASRFEFGPADFNIYKEGFITGPSGTYHRFMKKLCISKLFSGSQLDRFNQIREQELTNLIKSLLKSCGDGEECDLSMGIMTLTNNLICRMGMSKRCSGNGDNEAKEIRKLVVDIMESAAKLGVNEVFGPLGKFDLFGNGKKLRAALWRYDEVLEQIMKEYEDEDDEMKGSEEEGGDLMYILLETYRDRDAEVKLTRNKIKFFFLELFMATIDTSAAAIQWAMAELINHPRIFKKLREEIDSVLPSLRLVKESDVPNLPYLQAIIKETLRLHSPTPIIHRQCIKDCKINGFDVMANTKILINAYAIMRDPDSWNLGPDEFLPDRHPMESKGQDFSYIPFGSGRRGCIGSMHALTVMHVTIGALVQCFDWKVKGGEKVDIDVGSGFTGAMAHPLVCYPVTHFDPFK